MVGPTGDVIGYTIYGNNTTSFPITRGAQFDFGGAGGIAQSFGLIAGPGAKTLPLYVSSITGSNVAAGLYTETLSIAWSWNYCSGIGIGGICAGRDIGSGTASLTVSMTVTNDCQITAPNISFGSAPVISGFTAVTGQTISISCTKGSAYNVGLSDGQNAVRSEEHTSELQSRLHLVCRLLLEKKKYIETTKEEDENTASGSLPRNT